MAKLNSMPKYQAKLPRTGFDIGRDFYFTSSVGMILPIYRARLNPGETIDFGVSMKTILRPLRRPTQCKIRQKVDVFFVPEQMLFTGFGQHFYQTNDFVTSGTFQAGQGSNSAASLPLMSLMAPFMSSELNLSTLEFMFPTNWESTLPMDNGYKAFDSVGKSAYRLMMHLGYNPNAVLDDAAVPTGEFSTWQPNVYPDFLLAYNAIYQNYYRNDEREQRELKTYQFDFAFNLTPPAVLGLYPKTGFFVRQHQRIKDYFTSVKVSPIMSILNAPMDSLNVLQQVNNFLYPISNSGNDFNGSSPYLTGTDYNPSVALSDFHSTLNDDVESNARFSAITSDNNYVNTANIRSIFALEKLLRITGRARKNYDSQVLAHLGFKVPRDVKHEITFLGSIDGGIGVTTHVAAAGSLPNDDSGMAALGEQFGNGQGSLNGKCRKFTAPCHGVLMAVTYAIPETSYPLGHYVDKLNNVTSRLDLYIPEFDQLGMQPLYLYEHYSDNYNSATQNCLNTGWQFRYEQYKRQYDVHSIAFYNPHGSDLVNSWSPWVLGNVPFNFYDTDREWKDEDDHSKGYNLNYQFPTPASFMVAPTFLNGIFVQDYDTNIYLSATSGQRNDAATPWLMFQTDPFMHACRIECKLVSTMSTFGEPELT